MKKNILIAMLAIALAAVYCTRPLNGGPASKPLYLLSPSGIETAVIADAEAWDFTSQFKIISRQSNIVNSGGLISRVALEDLLSRPGCNAVSFRLCIDTTGRYAPINSVFLVMGASNVTGEGSQMTAADISGNRYASRHWCPPTCMKFMIMNPNTGRLEPVE